MLGKDQTQRLEVHTQLYREHLNIYSNLKLKTENFMLNMCIISNYLISCRVKLCFFVFFSLQVKERPDVGVYIKDLIGYVVNNADDMDKIMMVGHKNSKQTTK